MGPRIIAASNNLNLKEAYYSRLLISLSAYVLSFVAGFSIALRGYLQI